MNYEIFFIGTTKGLEKKYIEQLNLFNKTYYLDSEGFKRSISIKNIRALYKHFKNKLISKKLLNELRPNIVIGMGGYISGAVVRSAIKLNIKTMIHEQNSVYGLANRFLKSKVNKVLLTYNIDNQKNVVLVGNPRVTEIYERYKTEKHLDEDYILVVGGSRGAKKINDLIISMEDKFMKNNLKVILIVGNKYFQENKDKINKVNSEVIEIKDFVSDLPKYLLKAKVVITRSGATTLAEVMALRKTCIFIPSPNVTANHQEMNAKAICDFGGGIMLTEKDLNEEILFKNILSLYYDKNLRNKIVNNIVFNTDLNSLYKFIYEIEKLGKGFK